MRNVKVWPLADKCLAGWATIGFAFVVAVACCLASGCVPSHAVSQARTQYLVNEAYAEKGLGQPATGIAEDNADAWAVQLQALDGGDLPAPVVERMERRGDLGEGDE